MRGPKPKHRIELTTEEEQSLRRLVSAHKSPQDQVLRARILLMAHDHPEWSNQQIAREAAENPQILHDAPHNSKVRRLDEVAAARKPCLAG